MSLPFEIGVHYPLKVNLNPTTRSSSSELSENPREETLVCFQYPFKPTHCDDGAGSAVFDTKDKKWVVKLSSSLKRTLGDLDGNEENGGRKDGERGEGMEVFKGFDTQATNNCLLSFKAVKNSNEGGEHDGKSGNGNDKLESEESHFVIEAVGSISRLKHIKPGEESHAHAKHILEHRAEQRAMEDNATAKRYKSIASGQRRKLNPTSSK